MFHSITFSSYTYSSILSLSDQICNSPYCQPYNSYNAGSENLQLVLDQVIIYPKLIFLFSLITYLVDIVLILRGEILSRSLMGVKGLIHIFLLSFTHSSMRFLLFISPAHSTPEHTYHPSLPLTKQCYRERSSTCVFFIKQKKKRKKRK